MVERGDIIGIYGPRIPYIGYNITYYLEEARLIDQVGGRRGTRGCSARYAQSIKTGGRVTWVR